MKARTDLVWQGADFGEGPRWHDGRLWFSDFYQHVVRALTPGGEAEVVLTLPGQPSGLGWLPDGTLLVVSMLDRKVLRVDDSDGTPRLHEHADLSGIATFHCNDMVVSERGHAYVGNFGFDLFSGATPQPAALALVHPDGTAEVAADDLFFPNGCVITPDGATLIVGETTGSRYSAFTIDDDGRLHDRRVWAEVPGAFPDGCCLDAEGGIWMANPGGRTCLRVVEGGEITHTVDASATCFACMLGGDDGRALFVLTGPASGPEELTGKGLCRVEAVTVPYPHAGLP